MFFWKPSPAAEVLRWSNTLGNLGYAISRSPNGVNPARLDAIKAINQAIVFLKLGQGPHIAKVGS